MVTHSQRQHALFHYQHMIEDFGTHGGLCSSITESHHITAVRRPWCQSNRYRALGQMLLTNQHLNNLLQHGMLRGGHTPGRNILLPPNAQAFPPNGNNGDDEGPVDENILGHVILAQSCGMN
jgi:hypothetical protein